MVVLATVRSAAGRMSGGGAVGGRPAPANDAFAAAEAHTRRVRMLRRVIPILCVGAVVIAMIGPLLNPFKAINADVAVSSIAVQGSKLTMEMPKLSGFKKDSKAYEVTADAATQDIKKPNIVELRQPIARIEMDKNSWVRLSAQTGVYDSTTEKLVVSDKVSVKTETGYEMRLNKADVDFKGGIVTTLDPVEVDLPNGWVKSDRMQILDNGKRAVFEGRVRSEFRDLEPPAGDKEEPKGEKKP